MRVNPPSKIVKGLAEGTLRTTMTHLEKGDVVLVMESSATSINDFRPAPPVAPKRAEWGTVTDVSMNWVTVRLSNGVRHPLDYSPQTAVTIRDREIIEPAAVAEVIGIATLSWGTRGKVKRCKSSRPSVAMRGKVAA